MKMDEMQEVVYDRKQARAIIDGLENGGGILSLYAGDGHGIRTVNNLLSDDQLGYITGIVIGMLEDLIKDCEALEDEYKRGI